LQKVKVRSSNYEIKRKTKEKSQGQGQQGKETLKQRLSPFKINPEGRFKRRVRVAIKKCNQNRKINKKQEIKPCGGL